jgi:pyruvate formate lyase activating enzyme
VLDRLKSFAPALRSLDGGLTISGGEAMVQMEFTRRIFAGAKDMGLHTAIETSGFLGDKVDDRFLSALDLGAARHQELRSRDLQESNRPRTCADAAVRRAAGENRKAGMGALHARAGPDRRSRKCRGIARFVAPMKNVQWVEVQPFHQMGAFKWKAMNLEYKLVDTPAASPELTRRVIDQFRAAGCNAR